MTQRFFSPLREFIHSSASGGIVLIAAAILALILVNIGFAEEYDDLLHTEIGVAIGSFEVEPSLLHWINDGLMAIFFFFVGLEIKREILYGELSEFRVALLPILAALGGAIVPALIYTAFNLNREGGHGWGIPMATDIAFTLGVLALLGSRVPLSLKIFLTAIAIVDDLIAVLVIAIFYSDGLNWAALGIGIALLAFLVVANLWGVRNISLYLLVGVGVWFAFYESGIHATIAGVLLALTVPARNRIQPKAFLECARDILRWFEEGDLGSQRTLTGEEQQSAVWDLEQACEDVLAPLQKLEHRLHHWISFAIMPIFAFANAGVALSTDSLSGDPLYITLGILAGLIIGKPLGVFGATLLSVRLGLTSLPQGIRWVHLFGGACLTGIGFTMSLFIASLGLPGGAALEAAKIGILAASVGAAVLGLVVLSLISAKETSADAEALESHETYIERAPSGAGIGD